jgi:O-glycosyl hydrolase
MHNSGFWRQIGSVMRILVLIFIAFWGFNSCEEDTVHDDNPNTYLGISLNPIQRYQTIHDFGASDAWSCQFVGKNWPQNRKDVIADLLFSDKLKADGSPEGIALSSWRFNIGGGSAEQGGSSNISDEWRRAEAFIKEDKTYDWEKQQGQRWFLKAAQDHGIKSFTAFVNSPPVALTKNGKAFSSGGSSGNLSEENYAAYVNYLTEVIAQLDERDGISFDYISPFNEPQWDWSNSDQEGSPWLNSEVADIVRLLDAKILERNLAVKIEIPDAAQVQFLYSNHYRPGRGNQIDAFFKTDSRDYVGNLNTVVPKIAAHSYYSTWDTEELIETRRILASKLAQYPDLEYTMSEYTLLENNEEVVGGGRDLGIDPALYMARVIHADLTVAGASSWQWWLAVSPYDYKDGLVYIDYNKMDGKVYESKMLWALGNYSRFIRPGMTRIGVERSDKRVLEQTIGGVMVSSYIDPNTNLTVSVAINYGLNSIPIKLDIEGELIQCKIYRTAGGLDNCRFLLETNFEEEFILNPRSITTFVQQ